MRFNVTKCKTLRITRKTKNRIDYVYSMSAPSISPSNSMDLPPNLEEQARHILTTNPPNGHYTPLEIIASDKYLGVTLD
jgi:hypothetical protein